MMSSFRPPASTVIAAATDANETVGVNIATAANCTAGDDSNDCVVPQLRESSTEPWLSTNANGIINLADAATPSLSNNLADNCEDSVSNAYVESETEAEDMRMLREVEEIERAEKSKRQCKGKRKLFQSDEDADEDSYTDGFNESSADGDDGLWEYEGWSHLMTSEFPTGVSDNDMETGHLSDESQHDDAAREESLTPPPPFINDMETGHLSSTRTIATFKPVGQE